MAHITDRLLQSKWGVFNHYLSGIQNDPRHPNNQGAGATSWDECVRALDAEKLARGLHDCGAHYYFITLMQGNETMIAPNRTFDEIAGTKPGEACSSRDLVLDIYNALKPYDIDLYLYYTGDGPYKNNTVGSRFGFTEPRDAGVTMPFVEKWSAVLEEYAVRYGDKVRGWWIDGCYRNDFRYNDTLMKPYYDAVKKGNPDAIVAFNDGVKPYYQKNYVNEDFVSGEFSDFFVIPRERFIEGAQAFLLAPLGIADNGVEWDAWGHPGVKRDSRYLRNFISCCNASGGVVTVDIALNRDGSFDPAQAETLAGIGI